MNVLVAISGGIAAYKIAGLVREFVKRGAEVKVVMTETAKDFITPLTLATLSQNPVYVENFDPTNGSWNSHISLGLWADVMVIAPATANTIAKMACGIADNLLLCTYLSARCPVWIAPSMDLDMYTHISTQRNIETLINQGVNVIDPEEGFLASGLHGKGRMAEPAQILESIYSSLSDDKNFSGKKVIITSGGTVERIDPVRYISNFSTGLMGSEIAEQFATRGADVVLIKTVTAIKAQSSKIKTIEVTSASEMYDAVQKQFKDCDIAVFAAAVSDYTVTFSDTKIKHTEQVHELQLLPTKDIAYQMGLIKQSQICIGFALETNDAVANAQKKLENKNLDAIVLNSLENAGAGFGLETNQINIISKSSNISYPVKSKKEVAKDIVNFIHTLC